MSELTAARRFNWRALTSMLTTGGFLIMSVTGLVLFITPEGRLAYWVDWSILGLTKTQWGDIHVTSSLLFVAVGIIHLWFNWRQFMAYLRSRFQARLTIRPEGPVAAVFCAVLVAGTLYGVPPFTSVLDLSAAIKQSWSADPAMEPPFGHAEEVTIKTLALRTASNADAIVAALKNAGFKVESANQTVRQLADLNGTSPAALWLEVQKRVPETLPADIAAGAVEWTPQEVESRFEGKGFGNKTIEQAAGEIGLPVAEVRARLAAQGIEADAGERIRPVADAAGTTPTEILKAVLVPGYRIGGH